jgi:hypothetical protein
METDEIVDDCNRVTSPEDCGWNGQAWSRRVFPGDAEAQPSTSFVSLLSLCLIDHPKQNDADLVERHANSFRLHTLLDTTDLYVAQLHLEITLLGSDGLILGLGLDGLASRQSGGQAILQLTPSKHHDCYTSILLE